MDENNAEERADYDAVEGPFLSFTVELYAAGDLARVGFTPSFFELSSVGLDGVIQAMKEAHKRASAERNNAGR